MKKTINLGAYGWSHKHWLESFYPDDLPVGGEEDWRLAYYSNEFDAVMVPADYWLSGQVSDCEDWMDSVHPEFQFFVECDFGLPDQDVLKKLSGVLDVLKPQLSALVFINTDKDESDVKDTAVLKNQLIKLADSMGVDVLGEDLDRATKSPRFTYFEDELKDLRIARAFVDQFAGQFTEQFSEQRDDGDSATDAVIIVKHPQLKAENLSKFKSVLEIMGY